MQDVAKQPENKLPLRQKKWFNADVQIKTENQNNNYDVDSNILYPFFNKEYSSNCAIILIQWTDSPFEDFVYIG